MTKHKKGGGQQGNILIISAISIWVTIMLIAGGMVVAAAAGYVDTSMFSNPAPAGNVEQLPTLLPTKR
ncbi:MAG: hypothetical protein HC806_10270 [Anaerolineae bacterium]|nr:hypothetical protein [Anaerolineae bacterium]